MTFKHVAVAILALGLVAPGLNYASAPAQAATTIRIRPGMT